MTDLDKKRKNEIAKYIGNNIYRNRKNKKVTREELAEKSNLSANHIYEIEMGNCMPTALTLIDICISLNISISQIIDVNLLKNKDVVYDNFLDDFQRLSEKEKNIVINLIQYMANT